MSDPIGQNPLVLYNWNPATQLQGYLNAQAAVAAGVPGATAKIVAVGDSTTVGVGSSSDNLDYRDGGSYPTDLAKDLTSDGVPAQSDNFLGGKLGEDGRITLLGDASWSDVGVAGGSAPVTGSAGSGLEFKLTSPGVYDRLSVDYLDVGTGALTISVDGGLATTLQLGNTGQTLTQTIGLPAGLHSEASIVSASSTPVYIEGAAFANTAAPSVQVYNAGVQGQDSAIIDQKALIGDGGATQIGVIPGAIELAPNLVLINYGINDIVYSDYSDYSASNGLAGGTITAAQTAANIARMVADFQKNGTDVIIVIPQPILSPGYLAEIPALRADIHAVADAMNVPVIDLSATYGDDFSALAAAGLMGDSLHPDATLYADIAANYAKLLTSISNLTASDSTLVVQHGVASTVTGSGNAITIGYDSVVNVVGDANSVAPGGGDTVNAIGSGNTVATPYQVSVNLAGDGNTAALGAPSYVNVQQGLNVAVTASASTLVMRNGTSSTLSGSGNAITASYDSLLNVVGDGNSVAPGGGDTVNVTGNANAVTSADAIGVTLKGSAANTVTAGAGSYVDVQQGLNVAVTASTSVLVVRDGTSSNLFGSGNAITAGSNTLVDVIGDGNSVVAHGGDTVNVTGNANAVTSADAIGVTLKGSAANTVTAGAGSYVDVQQGLNVAVTASASVLVVRDGTSSNLFGSGNAITAGSNTLVDVIGDGNSVVAHGGDTVNVTGNANAVTSADAIGVTIGESTGNTVTAGAGSFVTIRSGAAAAVTASGSTLTVQDGAAGTLFGSNDAVTIGAGASAAINGSGNTIFTGSPGQSGNIAAIDLVSVTGNSNMVFLGPNQVNISDNSSGLTLVLSPSTQAANGLDIINGFGAARGAVVDLTGGTGGYATAAAAFQAIVPDGHGGSLLALNSTASLDFAGLPQNGLSAANFRVG